MALVKLLWWPLVFPHRSSSAMIGVGRLARETQLPRPSVNTTREAESRRDCTPEGALHCNMAGATDDCKCAYSLHLHARPQTCTVATRPTCLPATTSRSCATCWAIPPLPQLHRYPYPAHHLLHTRDNHLQTFPSANCRLTALDMKLSAKRRPTLPMALRSA
jgi:hypothetical protein